MSVVDLRATKDRHERETEEADRLVRPSPKDKPPRHDKRREEMQTDRDPDVEADKDLKGDPDLSMNYKTIGGSVAQRVASRFAKEKMVTVRLKQKPDAPATTVTETTLREEPGKYERVKPEQDPQGQPKQAPKLKPPTPPGGPKPPPGAPEPPPPAGAPAQAKPKPEGKSEGKPPQGAKDYAKLRGTLEEMAANDPQIASLLKSIQQPGSGVGGLAKGNPEYAASKVFGDRTPPKGIETLGDLLKAMQAPKPKKKPKVPGGGDAGTSPDAIAKAVTEAMAKALPEMLKAIQGGGQKAEPSKEEGKAKEPQEEEGQDKQVFKKPSSKVIAEAKAKAGETTWSPPDLAEEEGELTRTAEALGVDPEALQQAAQSAQLEDLDDDVWSELENTDSFDTDTVEKAVALAKEYNRDIDRVLQGIGKDMPAPLVLLREGEPPYLVGGNTRLMAARATGAKPKILAIHLDAEGVEPEGVEPEEAKPERKKRKVRPDESLQSTELILNTFPPSVARGLLPQGLHPDEVKQLAATYQAAANEPLGAGGVAKLAKTTTAFYATNPDHVDPPDFVYNAAGRQVSLDEVRTAHKEAEKLKKKKDPEAKARLEELKPLLDVDPDEAEREYQLATVAYSLAAQTQIAKTLEQKSGAPRKLAHTLANFMLGIEDKGEEGEPEDAAEAEQRARTQAERMDRASAVAQEMFHTTLKTSTNSKPVGGKEIKQILNSLRTDPAAQKVAVAYFQAQDYQAARAAFLTSGEISERTSPEEMIKSFKKADKFLAERQRRYPGNASYLHTPSLFRIRVLKQLRTLAPDKFPVVQAKLDAHDQKQYDKDSKVFKKQETAYYKHLRKAEEKSAQKYDDYLRQVESSGEFIEPVPPEPFKPESVSERLAGIKEPSDYDKETNSRAYKAYMRKWHQAHSNHQKDLEKYEEDYAAWEEASLTAADGPVKPPPSINASLQEAGLVAPEEPVKPHRYEMPASMDPARMEHQSRRREWSKQRKASAASVANRYSFYFVGESMGHNTESVRTAVRLAVYHGVEPYQAGEQGFEDPYPGWQQAHARDLTAADFNSILANARKWLQTPVLAASMEGVVRDTQVRAALDLAIQDHADGKYQAALHPAIYDDLLAKLAGKSTTDPLLTVAAMGSESIYGATPREDSMNASNEIRQFAARVANSQPELSYDLMALADKVAGLPPEFLENIKKKKDEAKDGDKKEDKDDKKQAAAPVVKQASNDYTALRSLVIKTASAATPEERLAFAPILQALKKS